MTEPDRREFGDVDELDVEAIGQAGQRTFRLLVEQGANTASVWVEKEQLQALAVIIEQQGARFRPRRAQQEQVLLTLAARFPSRPTVEFKAGRIAVGYDERHDKFVLTADDIEGGEGRTQSFTCRVGPDQVRAVCAKISDIVAAGRPRCPLCGAPIDGTHVCPLANGHVTT
jgi:uncharacterized repeat protein (TIGR03847 family)